MKFRQVSWAVAAVVLALVPASVASGTTPAPPPDRIDLPDGWQPEGITSHGKYLYVGSLANGAIWRADSRSGEGEILARGGRERVAVGVDYDRCRDLLWVAGGATKKIHVHDAVTGQRLETYRFPSGSDRFLNDLVVTRRGVYATDSMNQQLAVIPFARSDQPCADGAELPPPRDARTLPLTGDLEYEDGFNLNGIVRSGAALLAVQSNTGLLFKIDRRTGDTTTVDLGGASLTNGDGLEIADDILYVVRNQLNLIAVIELADDLESGEEIGGLGHEDFDVPTTVTLTRNSLWAVNARFGTEVTPDTPYWITRLDVFP